MTTVKIDKDGLLSLPASLAEQLGVPGGGELSAEIDAGGRLIITSLQERVVPAVPAFTEAVRRKNLAAGIQHIKGVGPKLVEAFQRLGVVTLEDALFLL